MERDDYDTVFEFEEATTEPEPEPEPDYAHCWVCDAIANPILDADGEMAGTDCGCDDLGVGDGPGHGWER